MCLEMWLTKNVDKLISNDSAAYEPIICIFKVKKIHSL